MGEFHTGATVVKNFNLYQVKFRGKIVAQYAVKDVAIMLALNRVALNKLFESSIEHTMLLNG